MKRIMVIDRLKDALYRLDELIKASKGDDSRCSCKDFEDIGLYVNTWIKYPIEVALEEIERKK